MPPLRPVVLLGLALLTAATTPPVPPGLPPCAAGARCPQVGVCACGGATAAAAVPNDPSDAAPGETNAAGETALIPLTVPTLTGAVEGRQDDDQDGQPSGRVVKVVAVMALCASMLFCVAGASCLYSSCRKGQGEEKLPVVV